MTKCAKVHLTTAISRISTFFRGGPPDPSLSEKEVREGERGIGKGRRGKGKRMGWRKGNER